MATLMFFEDTVKDQGGKVEVELEFGRSSYYAEDSIYFVVNDEIRVLPDRETAAKIVGKLVAAANYLGLDYEKHI